MRTTSQSPGEREGRLWKSLSREWRGAEDPLSHPIKSNSQLPWRHFRSLLSLASQEPLWGGYTARSKPGQRDRLCLGVAGACGGSAGGRRGRGGRAAAATAVMVTVTERKTAKEAKEAAKHGVPPKGVLQGGR